MNGYLTQPPLGSMWQPVSPWSTDAGGVAVAWAQPLGSILQPMSPWPSAAGEVVVAAQPLGSMWQPISLQRLVSRPQTWRTRPGLLRPPDCGEPAHAAQGTARKASRRRRAILRRGEIRVMTGLPEERSAAATMTARAALLGKGVPNGHKVCREQVELA